MAALAEVSDLIARLGRDLSETEEARATVLLDDASAAVRAFTKQTISQATSTDRLTVRNGRVRLPQRPVTVVSAVTDVNENPILFTWDGVDSIACGSNLIDTFAWEPWRNGIKSVLVTYTHGYATIPDVVVGVVCQVAVRAFGLAPERAAMTQESAGPFSYTIGSAAASGGFGLLAAEKEALAGFLRSVSVAQVGP